MQQYRKYSIEYFSDCIIFITQYSIRILAMRLVVIIVVMSTIFAMINLFYKGNPIQRGFSSICGKGIKITNYE